MVIPWSLPASELVARPSRGLPFVMRRPLTPRPIGLRGKSGRDSAGAGRMLRSDQEWSNSAQYWCSQFDVHSRRAFGSGMVCNGAPLRKTAPASIWRRLQIRWAQRQDGGCRMLASWCLP